MNPRRLVDHLITLNTVFVETHPAFVVLLDAPHSTRISEAPRARLRNRFTPLFLARRPRMSKEKAGQIAMVTLHILAGRNQLYAEAPAARRSELVAEFKAMLSQYLGSRMGLEA
ncbi:MAG TPA: hypothetical protein VKX39_10420 [Bryobacteraceae bacterium]|nr:hypothetical protein [Bryobacteraceae bacterium]